MSKILKSPWFWFALIAVIIIAGYFLREQYLNGTGVFSSGGAEDQPSTVDLKPGTAASSDAVQLSTTPQTSIPFQAGN